MLGALLVALERQLEVVSGCVACGSWCSLATLAKFSARLNTFVLAVPALSISEAPWPKLAHGGLVDTSMAACHPSTGCVSAAGGECYGLCLAEERVSRKYRAACQSHCCGESGGPVGLFLHEHVSDA